MIYRKAKEMESMTKFSNLKLLILLKLCQVQARALIVRVRNPILPIAQVLYEQR